MAIAMGTISPIIEQKALKLKKIKPKEGFFSHFDKKINKCMKIIIVIINIKKL